MRIPLVYNLKSRDGTLDADEQMVNAIAEVSMGKPVMKKRPGIASVASLGSSTGKGITSYTDSSGVERLFSVNSGTLYLPNVKIPSSSAWTVLNGGSDAFQQGVLVSFGGYLWSIGGSTGTSTKVYYKASLADSWTLAATGLWGGVRQYDFGIAVLNNKLYMIGGSDGTASGQPVVRKSADAVTWETIQASATFGNAYQCRVAVLNDTIFLIGANIRSSGWTNTVWSSTDGVTWTSLTTSPAFGGSGVTLRENYSVCAWNGKLWVVGGIVNSSLKQDVWYSSDGITWTQATASAGFGNHAEIPLFAMNGSMFMAGGATNTGLTSYDSKVYYTTDGATWTQISASAYSTGMTVSWSGTSVAVFGDYPVIKLQGTGGGNLGENTIYTTSMSDTNVSAGTISAPANAVVDFEAVFDNSSIFVHTPTAGYKLTTATNAITTITDADYPPLTVPGAPYLNGIFYVMTPDGDIYGSAEDDCTSWSATNVLNAEFASDGGVRLCKYNQYILALGVYTAELFWDAGNSTGSSLEPVDSGVLMIGCASAGSVAQMESTVIWMAQRKGSGSNFQKGRFIAMMEGQSYKQISNPDIERLMNADDLSTVYATVLSVAGHSFYILVLKDTGITLVYDFSQQTWGQWTRRTTGSSQTLTSLTQSSGTATATKTSHGFSDGDQVVIAGATPSGYNGTYNITVTSSSTFTFPVSSSLSTPASGTITATGTTESYFHSVSSCNYNGQQVFQGESDGKIYQIAETTYTDESVTIDVRVRTIKWDGDTMNNKFMSALRIVGDQENCNLLVRYTDDDYQTYSYYRPVSLNQDNPRLNRLGKFRRRAFQVRHTASTGLILDGLEPTIEKGLG